MTMHFSLTSTARMPLEVYLGGLGMCLDISRMSLPSLSSSLASPLG
ncbi:MAG: hypothetical protein HA491_01795 [Candidatus Verstraetearchaeota archaeon]|nr:hypothetical protein [Candidatus Verstraetearchaeota archaeon]